jgi:hypothetical protein
VSVGPVARFLIEAAVIVTAAVVAGLTRLSTLAIVFVVGGAWLLAAFVEWLVWFLPRVRVAGAPPAFWARPSAEDGARAGAVSEPEPAPVPVAVLLGAEREPEPEPAPEPDVTPGPAPEPEREPERPPAPEPPETAPEPPRIAAAPPPPEPEREPEPEPEPAGAHEQEAPVVSLALRFPGPQEWNLWDLERLARERAGRDALRDEERSFVLMYLREYANADGLLPADFDGIVRESFGDLLTAFA